MAKRSTNAKRKTKQAPAKRRTSRAARMPFERRNYVLLLGAIALIVAGYAIMLVDNAVSDNPVDSALSLTVAPLLLLGGYIGVLWAVLAGVRETGASGAEAPASGEAAPAEA